MVQPVDPPVEQPAPRTGDQVGVADLQVGVVDLQVGVADLPPQRHARTGRELLAAGRERIQAAHLLLAAGDRYATAHLAALRGAAAVLAVRAHPGQRRGRPVSAWTLLAAVAPELGEWAAFFAAGASKRAAVEAGRPHAVSEREANDLLRDAEQFLELVAAVLSAAAQPVGPPPGPPTAAPAANRPTTAARTGATQPPARHLSPPRGRTAWPALATP